MPENAGILEIDPRFSEALTIIDRALGTMMTRELVTTGEVTDTLLDVRTILTPPAN